MRRASMAVLSAVAGTAVLVGLKVPHGTPAPASADSVATAPLDPGSGALSGTGAGAGTRPPAGGATPSAAAPAPGRTATTPGTPGRTATAGPKPPPTTTQPTTRTVDGSRERAGSYGYVRVQITVSGGRMTAITMLEVTSRPNSAARTAPQKLIQQALAAQSANIGNVSGATYTSDAFKASLQSALNQV